MTPKPGDKLYQFGMFQGTITKVDGELAFYDPARRDPRAPSGFDRFDYCFYWKDQRGYEWGEKE